MTVRMSGVGRAGQMSPVSAVDTTEKRNGRVVLDRGHVDEWYESGPNGLEQGFTVAVAPAGSGPLVVEVAFEGTLEPVVREGFQDVLLRDRDGRARLRYHGLVAWDADGRELPARLDAVADAPRVAALVVKDEGARYPVTIDPWVSHAAPVLQGAAPSGGLAGDGVAVSGDTAAVGDGFLGRVWIFRRHAGGPDAWGLVATLTGPAGEAGEFGASLALDGDTLVVGAPLVDAGVDLDVGAVYVHERNAGGVDAWGQTAVIQRATPVAGDRFGAAVDVDGELLIAGADGAQGLLAGTGAAYVYARDHSVVGAWNAIATVSAADGVAADQFGAAVAIDEGLVFVGAPGHDASGDAAGAAYIYSRNLGGADAWGQLAKLLPAGLGAGDAFGAALDVAGNLVVVGAPQAGSLATAPGRAFLFGRNAGGADAWGLVTTFNATVATAGDGFGTDVAVAADSVLIGARAAVDEDGAAYAFARNEGGADAWGLTERWPGTRHGAAGGFGRAVALDADIVLAGAVDASLARTAHVFTLQRPGSNGATERYAQGAAPGDLYGSALSANADYMAVGRPGAGVAGPLSGAVAVLDRNAGGGDAWGQVALLAAPGGQGNDGFGAAVALHGTTLVAGAPHDNPDDPPLVPPRLGEVHVYEQNQGGPGAWGHVATLVGTGGASEAEYGTSVAVYGDLIAVGSRLDDTAGTNAGAVYLYERNLGGPDAWGLLAKLTAPDAADYDYFGSAVALHDDRVLVGATWGDGNVVDSGSAYVFARDQGGAGAWGLVAELATLDGAEGDRFGADVAFDGATAVVGAPWHDARGSAAGAAYVFDRNRGGADAWGRARKILPTTISASDEFGTASALAGDLLLVGSERGDGVVADSGAAYLFHRNLAGADAWGELRRFTAADGADSDTFGYAVALMPGVAAMAAYRDDDSGIDAGSVYFFDTLVECAGGFFGPSCDACPGGASTPCNDHGLCDDGKAGTGVCACDEGYAGAACDACEAGYWGYPNCQPCGDCDDGNLCTDDSCDVVVGCVHANNTEPCDDANACTTDDTCSAGTCAGGPPLDCNDGNVCTDDGCDPATGCTYTDNSAPCDDGDACTTGEGCVAGGCGGGTPIVCDDGNDCTDDGCDPATGCVFTPNAAPCDDGDLCTTVDVCADGGCTGTTPLLCDDGDPCNGVETCDSGLGCLPGTPPPNRPPVANTGGPYVSDVGAGLQLNGGGSSDPDSPCGDSIVSYAWDLNNDGLFDDAVGALPALSWLQLQALGFAYPADAGTGLPANPIALQVVDSHGLLHTTSSTVTIYENQPSAVVNALPNPASCDAVIDFDALGSSHSHPGHSIVRYDWDFGDGTSAIDSGSLAQHQYDDFGTFTVTLTVYDDNSPPKTTTATVVVDTTLGNDAPVAAVDGPHAAVVGDDVTLDASASVELDADCGDSIVSYVWDLDNDGLFDDAAGPIVILGWAQALSLGLAYPADPLSGLPNNVVSVRVADDSGQTSTASTTVHYIDCDDGDACTLDSADPIAGCLNSPISCDDGNGCTEDSCDPATGCVHKPIVPCNWDQDCIEPAGTVVPELALTTPTSTFRIDAAGAADDVATTADLDLTLTYTVPTGYVGRYIVFVDGAEWLTTMAAPWLTVPALSPGGHVVTIALGDNATGKPFCGAEASLALKVFVRGLCNEDAQCADADTCSNGACVAQAGLAPYRGRCRFGQTTDTDCCVTSEWCRWRELLYDDGRPYICSDVDADGEGDCVACLSASDCVLSSPCHDGAACIDNACVYSFIAGCCTADGDCDDGNACTADACDLATNTCSNVELPDCCLPGRAELSPGPPEYGCTPAGADPCRIYACIGSPNGTCKSGPAYTSCCDSDADCTDPRLLDSCTDPAGLGHGACTGLDADPRFPGAGTCEYPKVTPSCCLRHYDCQDQFPQSLGFCQAVAGQSYNECVYVSNPEYCAPPATGRVVIAELMIDSGPTDEADWVEVYNPLDASVDLNGWSLENAAGTEVVVLNAGVPLLVPGGGSLVLAGNLDIGGKAASYVYDWTAFALTADDTVLLRDDTGTVQDVVAWDATWPISENVALALLHPWIDNAVAVHWMPAEEPYGSGLRLGTPGAHNTDVFAPVVVEPLLDGLSCDDDDPCTLDVCNGERAGLCDHLPIEGCCAADGDCDDLNRCTVDLCDGASSTCTHTLTPGCCNTDEDCAVAYPAHIDTPEEQAAFELCAYRHCIAGTCRFGRNPNRPGCCVATDDPWYGCFDRSPCTVDACVDAAATDVNGTPYPACEFDSDSDGDGTEDCCTLSSDCDDGDPATIDTCNYDPSIDPPGASACLFTPDLGFCGAGGITCDDGDFCTDDICCTGPGTPDPACTEADRCAFVPRPDCCAAAVDCIDGNACTADSCCAGVGDPVASCTGAGVCAHEPVAGCCSTHADCNGASKPADRYCQQGYCIGGACRWAPPLAGCCVDASDCPRDTCTSYACTDHACVATPVDGCCTTQDDCPESGDACRPNACVLGVCTQVDIPDCCTDDNPAGPDLSCDDGSPCTADYCLQKVDGSWSCTSFPSGNPGCCISDLGCPDDNVQCTTAVCSANDCQLDPVTDCQTLSPYRMSFSEGHPVYAGEYATVEDTGWTRTDIGNTPAADRWRLSIGGPLGPDSYLAFVPRNGQADYEACAVMPRFRTTGMPRATLAFEYAALWAQGTAFLRVIGTTTVDWNAATELWRYQIDSDVEPRGVNVALPPELLDSGNTQLAFCVSVPVSAEMDEVLIDEVALAFGEPPQFDPVVDVQVAKGESRLLSGFFRVTERDPGVTMNLRFDYGPGPWLQVLNLRQIDTVTWEADLDIVGAVCPAEPPYEHEVALRADDGNLHTDLVFKVQVSGCP